MLCVTAERQFLTKSRNSLCVSVVLFFFLALGWQLQIWLSSGQLQLGRVDLQCVIYTGIFQREAEQIGKKPPNKTIHSSLQVKETFLYFKLFS